MVGVGGSCWGLMGGGGKYFEDPSFRFQVLILYRKYTGDPTWVFPAGLGSRCSTLVS